MQLNFRLRVVKYRPWHCVGRLFGNSYGQFVKDGEPRHVLVKDGGFKW